MSHYQAVIFDMDGVLFDSEAIHIRAWQKFLHPFGLSFSDEWYLQWVGTPDEKLAVHLHELHGLKHPPETILELKREVFRRMCVDELRPFEGVCDGVERIKARGWRVALCTATIRRLAQYQVEVAGLAGTFEAMVTMDDVAHTKPAPDAYLKAAELLGVAPSRCVVIEDSMAGIAAARGAGCLTLGVMSSHDAASLGEAHHVFPTTVEAIEALLGGGLLNNGKHGN